MRRVLAFLMLLFPVMAVGGLPFVASLHEMASEADHILIGRVVAVDMIDGAGRTIEDDAARTGPGQETTIRLHVRVEKVLVTNANSVPEIIVLPLADHLHYSLGQIRDAHRNETVSRLVLLKGNNFSAIRPGVFFRPLAEQKEALRIHAGKRQEQFLPQ